MRYRRWIALLLSAVMALSLSAMPAWAGEAEAEHLPASEPAVEASAPEEAAVPESRAEGQDTQQQDGEEGVRYRVNPGYEGSQEALEAELSGLEEAGLETQGSTKTVTSVKAAGKYLRGQMKKRKKSVTLTLKTKKGNGYGLWDDVMDEAVKVTGVPSEGDYLWGQTLSVAGRYRSVYTKKKNTHTFTFNLRYASTAAQEKKVDAAVKKLLTKLNLKKDSDAVKVHKIYNYICDNITYDHAGLSKGEDSCHSAYAALVRKKAVCQGYSTLLCRLLSECGVSCRYVAGTGYGSGSSGAHAWNLVKLGGKYYNADATWDASLRQSGRFFQYYLRSDANFGGHIRDSRYTTARFKKACPMSKKDGNYHYWEKTVIWAATCTEDGLASVRCSDCGREKGEETIPALGHDWKVDWDSADYEKEYFRVQAYCSRCGIRDARWFYFDYEGNLLHVEGNDVNAQGADGPEGALSAAVREARPRRTA